MNKTLLFSSLLIFSFSSNQAQISTELINNELANKEWKIVQYETFGITEEPSPEQLNDKLLFKPDMSFLIVENGISHTGKWSIQSPYIFCKTEPNGWTRTYKVISVAHQKSTLEYKDQDLTKTLYYLEAQ